MFQVDVYIEGLLSLLKKHFGQRLLYVGLQGSYLRGEASPASDIDVMVIVDGLSVDDLAQYKTIIHSLEYADKSCGFICARQDLSRWNPLEISHVLHSTKDYYGTLKDWIPAYTKEDVRNFVKISLNNLYHEICHRFIHADRKTNIDSLPFAYKGVFFILQNIYHLQHGEFIATKMELLKRLDGQNHAVLTRAIEIQQATSYDFDDSFELLFAWCQSTLQTI
ncbi:MAG: nucleotidyltransferase domain-containing protein [Elusimicrobiaceae bacterium]|nr:nucleotidyltransferase domain-containing protein [Elusimicrobiaceae bacterium]